MCAAGDIRWVSSGSGGLTMRTFPARVGCVALLAAVALATPAVAPGATVGTTGGVGTPVRAQGDTIVFSEYDRDGGALVPQRAPGRAHAATGRCRAEPDAVRRRHRDRQPGTPGADLPALRDHAADPAGGRRAAHPLRPLRVLAGRRRPASGRSATPTTAAATTSAARSGAGESRGRASTAPSRTRIRSSTRSSSPRPARSPRRDCPACRRFAVSRSPVSSSRRAGRPAIAGSGRSSCAGTTSP